MVTKLSKAVSKYQQTYTALHSSGSKPVVDFFKHRTYQQAIVIPCFNESFSLFDRLGQLSSTEPTLVILVVNCPQYADSEAKQHTKKFISEYKNRFKIKNVSEDVTFGQLNSQLDLLLLDITNQQPRWLNSLQSGVGFARKVGMDMAIALWCQRTIRSSWVYNSDADVCWPEDYLNFDKHHLKTKGAAVLAFQHHSFNDSKSLSPAAALYDISLRYYVLGLRWSGSPWAYHTIGSTLLVHCESYAETRGFPLREAGEDFYLLNKIAKTAAIHSLDKPVLLISDRNSNRVPFGTGPAVNRIQQQPNPETQFTLYHPQIFFKLKTWHYLMPGLFQQALDKVLSKEPELLQGLKHLNIQKALHHCQQHTQTQEQFNQQLWQWFDGFKTLKLIHWFREFHFPSISYHNWKLLACSGKIPFVNTHNLAKDASFAEVSTHLQHLETQTLPTVGGLQQLREK